MMFTIKDHVSNITSEPVELSSVYPVLLHLRGKKLTPAFAEHAHIITDHIENSAPRLSVGQWTTCHAMDGSPEYTITAVQL